MLLSTGTEGELAHTVVIDLEEVAAEAWLVGNDDREKGSHA
jgi:hypothetical protein